METYKPVIVDGIERCSRSCPQALEIDNPAYRALYVKCKTCSLYKTPELSLCEPLILERNAANVEALNQKCKTITDIGIACGYGNCSDEDLVKFVEQQTTDLKSEKVRVEEAKQLIDEMTIRRDWLSDHDAVICKLNGPFSQCSRVGSEILEARIQIESFKAIKEWVDKLATFPKNDDYDQPNDGYERSFLDDLLNLSPKLKKMSPAEVSDAIHVIAPKMAALIYVLDGRVESAERVCEAALKSLGRKWNGTGCACSHCEATREAIDAWCKSMGR